MNRDEIIAHLKSAHLAFWKTALECPNATISVNGKWSVAQNTEHLNIALQRLGNYLALPKSSIASGFGLSDRASASYLSSLALFRKALGTGVSATDSYTPQDQLETSLPDLVDQGSAILDTFICNLQSWSEEDLETYNCPHPTLGKVTAREILYFTIYHVAHHHETILKIGRMNSNHVDSRQ